MAEPRPLQSVAPSTRPQCGPRRFKVKNKEILRAHKAAATLKQQAFLVTRQELETCCDDVASEVKQWDAGQFSFVRKLQDAPMNFGTVDHMVSSLHNSRRVAVKRMPNEWIKTSSKEFYERYPEASEDPWLDLAALTALQRRRCPYICELLGVFRDQESTYVVTSLASEGDFHTYCKKLPAPGQDRERALRPIIKQLFFAVQWLHERGFAQGDLSLEYVVLTDGASAEDGPQIRLIDFGMSTTAGCRAAGMIGGKRAYLAPEAYEDAYDPCLADVFALGVLLFAAAAEDYPWLSTRPGECKMFRYSCAFGFPKMLTKRKAWAGGHRSQAKVPDADGGTACRSLSEVFSISLVRLLDGLLLPQPLCRLIIARGHADRTHLFVAYAACGVQPPPSAWDCSWLRER